MSALLDLLGAGGLGTVFSGVSGLVGGWLTKRENRKLMELTNAHELKMAEVDQRTAEFELQASITLADKKIDLAQTEGQIEEDLINAQAHADVARSDSKAFEAGLEAAQKPTGYPFVDKFRAMTRPLITWSLYIFVVTIFWVLHSKVGGIVAEDTELLVKLYVYLVQSIIYLFIMAVSWWFMSRGEKSVQSIRTLIS
jgi:hypothetical protein